MDNICNENSVKALLSCQQERNSIKETARFIIQEAHVVTGHKVL